MLQTNSSGPSPGVLSLDMTPKTAVGHGGASDGDFTQEYDKQVKNIKSGERDEPAVERRSEAGEVKNKTATSDVKAQAKTEARNEAGQKAENKDEQAASEDVPGGNNLPLAEMRKMAAEAQQKDDLMLGMPGESVELADDVAEPGMEQLVAIINQPIEELSKMAIGQGVSVAVKDATAQKNGDDIQRAVVAGELSTEDSELSDLLLKDRGKDNDFSLLMRQPNQGRGSDMMQRGDRGFDSLLNIPGRMNTAAASIDTLTPHMSPLAGQGAANPLATPAPVAMTLATPMTQANWGGAVAERVVWMTNANMQEAEIQLHPRELGPIGIKITVQNEQTHVSFVAHHATTREALEAALPRLREMLSDNGLQPGSTDVSQHSFREREGQADGGSARGGSALADGSLEGDEHLLGDLMRGVGYANPSGVDAFA